MLTLNNYEHIKKEFAQLRAHKKDNFEKVRERKKAAISGFSGHLMAFFYCVKKGVEGAKTDFAAN
jgi:hypothetical protein